MLSQGVPMLLAGDEIGRTQRGNTQPLPENEISCWTGPAPTPISCSHPRVIALGATIPTSAAPLVHGRAIHGSGVTDIAWFAPYGKPMSEDHWAERPTQGPGRVPERP